MSDISQSFFDSFGGYTGSEGSVALQVPGRFPIAIGTHPYVMDVAKYDRQMLPITRQGADTGAEAGEQSLNNEGSWLRAGRNWEHGAGQTEWDIEGADRLRFLSSKGVDPWTRNEVHLHFDTTNARASESGVTPRLLAVSGYLYAVRKTGGSQEVGLTSDGSSWSTISTSIGTVNAMAADGARVWFATSTGLWYATYGATTATQVVAGTLTVCQAVGFVNGHLLVAKNNILYEVDSALAVVVALYTHWQASFTFDTIFAGPSYVYAAGHVGDVTECYRFGVDPTTGSLVKGAPAFNLEVGELLRTALFITSAVVFATSRGLRVGTFNAGGGIDYGPLITAPGDVRCLTAETGYVWFGWTNYDGSSTGVGRLKLGTFTDTLVPAYASDLMATAQGTVTGVARFQSKTWLAVDASGIYKQAATYVATAELRTGWVSYGSVQRKTVLDVGVKHSSLLSGQKVAVGVTDGWGWAVTIGESSLLGSYGTAQPLRINRTAVERVGITFTFTGNTSDLRLDRWELRSLPAPAEREERIIVPILMADQVQTPWDDGRQEPFNPADEWDYLSGLALSGEVVPYTEGAAVYDVRVLRLQVREPEGWDHRRAFFRGIFYVELQTV